MGSYDTIGSDLVGMVVDDLVVCGAEPLFMTDYLCTGHVVPERVAAIVGGVAAACARAGCALIGGETAEHPGLIGRDDFDLAGAATGVVEAEDLLGPHLVREGDALVAVASSGLHANGYSLVRHVLLDRVTGAGWSLDRHVDVLGRTLGEELLEPTLVYAADCLAVARELELHAMAHVTGGGLAGNLARVVPPGLQAVVDRGTWALRAVFSLVGEVGRVSQLELERTLNTGVGMVVVLGADRADEAVRLLGSRGLSAWVAGTVVADPDGVEGRATLRGTHR